MKKVLKRILAMTSLVVVVAISGLATIILFPQPLFANKMEFNEFTVYSNDEISKDIIPVLKKASDLVKQSELHDPDYTYDILLSYNSVFNKIDDKLLGFGASARATDNNVNIKVRIDLKRDLFFPTFHSACEGRLTYLITHEMVHCLQANKYGIMKFNPFNPPPMWKLEGYPEYISRQPKIRNKNYSLATEIDRYVDLEARSQDIWISIEDGGCQAPKYYYKGRLMMEYLMDVRNLSYDQILQDTISEDSVYAEMLAWRGKD